MNTIAQPSYINYFLLVHMLNYMYAPAIIQSNQSNQSELHVTEQCGDSQIYQSLE